MALTLMQAMASESDIEELYNLAGPGNRYRVRAMRLTVSIAQLANTPWEGRIAEPNVTSGQQQVATLKSFVDSLRPLVSTRSPIHHLGDDELADAIVEFWRGVKDAIPRAFEDPRRFSIQKSPGLFVMHRVAAQHVFRESYWPNRFSASKVSSTLSESKTYMVASFWRTGGQVSAYSSGAGHKHLAEQIIRELR